MAAYSRTVPRSVAIALPQHNTTVAVHIAIRLTDNLISVITLRLEEGR